MGLVHLGPGAACRARIVPARVRVAAWHRGERPTRRRWPLHAWEPVIYHGGRQLITGTRRAGSIVCGVAPLDTLPGRVIGAKPAAVCRWIFTLLGACPGDTLDDLFPGSGAVGRAWAAFIRSPDPSLKTQADASSGPQLDASYPAACDASPAPGRCGPAPDACSPSLACPPATRPRPVISQAPPRTR